MADLVKEVSDAVAADAEFKRKLDALIEEKRRRAEVPHWFQRTYPDSHLTAVAYFSLESMLSDALRSTRAAWAMWLAISESRSSALDFCISDAIFDSISTRRAGNKPSIPPTSLASLLSRRYASPTASG
jgi:hypothetical protein